jgi:hypothetical protein
MIRLRFLQRSYSFGLESYPPSPSAYFCYRCKSTSRAGAQFLDPKSRSLATRAVKSRDREPPPRARSVSAFAWHGEPFQFLPHFCTMCNSNSRRLATRSAPQRIRDRSQPEDISSTSCLAGHSPRTLNAETEIERQRAFSSIFPGSR